MVEKKNGVAADQGAVRIVPPGAGKTVRRRFGEQTTIKIAASETGGAYALRENTAPGEYTVVPFHIHHEAEEAFFILEGVMTITTPEQTMEAPAGSFVLIPRRTVHSFANHRPTPLRWLTLFSPGWVSGWIDEESDLLREAGAGEPDRARQAAIYKKYGLELVDPPPTARPSVRHAAGHD